MSTWLFVHWGWLSRGVHEEDNWTCRKRCSPASEKNISNSLQMPTWHSKEREEPDMVSLHGKSIISLPRSSWERSTKRESTRRFLTALKKDEVFRASQLQHNWKKAWCKIWITSEQSIFRTAHLQNNWNDTLRCISFGTIRNKWQEDPKQTRLPSKYTSYRKHEPRSKSDSRIKKTSQLPRWSEPREARLAWWLSHKW